MGLFGKIRQKLFGSKEKPSPFRSKKEADWEADYKAELRKKMLEERVKKGESAEVYPNRKKIHSQASLKGAWGDRLSTLEAFLDGYILSQFASSNVWAVQYDRKSNRLYVQYMGGKGKRKSGPGIWYGYADVSLWEAKLAYVSVSKGVFSWQYLRRAKKNFRKGDAPPGHLPYGGTNKSKPFMESP